MMKKSFIFLLAIISFITFLDSKLIAQVSSSDTLFTVDQYMNMESVNSPQISPDGSQIIYTRSRINGIEDQWDSELWVMNTDGSKNRYLTDGSNPKWSPDGTRIAYHLEGKPQGTQIFVRWMDDEGATSQITHVNQTPSSVKWSPDGSSLAFIMLVPYADSLLNISLPKSPEGANWTNPPRMVSNTKYRQDRADFLKKGIYHLFKISADGGTPLQLTDSKWDIEENLAGLQSGADIDWMPDGEHIVFEGLLKKNPARDGFRQSYIYKINTKTRETTQLVDKKGGWSGPVVSPSGEKIAFTGSPYALQTYHASELYTVNSDGSNFKKISGNLDRDIGSVHWSANGEDIFFAVPNEGTQNIYRSNLSGNPQEVTEGNHMVGLSSVSANNQAVGVRSSYHSPSNIVVVDLTGGGSIEKLTNINSELLSNKKFGEVEEVWYTSTDNTKVQGWIVKPPSFDPSQDYPLILQIHGGPHAMYDVEFSYSYQNYAANGYVVLYTNPRGSTGYGTEFGNAIDNRYPSIDHEDLMAGVDEVISRGYINEDRLYVTGCSGGGVLSSWAIGQTDRFAAAAVRCPVTNWLSFAGTTDGPVSWSNQFESYPWENPDKWLQHSPLMYVGNVTTPTLLMTGELDLRTPIAQTEEYYSALKILGVPTVMLRFKKEYHGTSSKPSNFMRTQLYIMEWFEKYDKNQRWGDETK